MFEGGKLINMEDYIDWTFVQSIFSGRELYMNFDTRRKQIYCVSYFLVAALIFVSYRKWVIHIKVIVATKKIFNPAWWLLACLHQFWKFALLIEVSAIDLITFISCLLISIEHNIVESQCCFKTQTNSIFSNNFHIFVQLLKDRLDNILSTKIQPHLSNSSCVKLL